MVSYVERFLDCWLGKNPLWQLYGEGVSEKGKGKKEIIRCPDVVLRRTDPYYKFGYVCLRLASAACSTFTLFFPTAIYICLLLAVRPPDPTGGVFVRGSRKRRAPAVARSECVCVKNAHLKDLD